MSTDVAIDIDQYSINIAKGLIMDTVRNADSGHTGGAFSSLDYTYTLFKEFLKFDPDDPQWKDRDRFVLSVGHESALMYTMLYYIGWITLDDLRTADILLHVVDISDKDYRFKVKEVMKLIDELGLSDIPILRVNNKSDKANLSNLDELSASTTDQVWISAQKEEGFDKMRQDINNGNKIWVMARAVAYCKGVELGGASMGGLHYDSYEDLKKDILNDEHNIIHEALKEARGSLKTLKGVKAPAEEQLTSQFMEGQVY